MLIQQGLTTDCVRDLEMSRAVVVAPSATIGETVALMREQRVGCVLVQDRGTLRGIFTERDVLTKVLHGGAPNGDAVETVMTPNPKTTKPGDSLGRVVHTMHRGGLRHLPVMDDKGAVSGVISVKRIIQHLVEHFPQAVYNLPPNPAAVATAREGG